LEEQLEAKSYLQRELKEQSRWICKDKNQSVEFLNMWNEYVKNKYEKLKGFGRSNVIQVIQV